MYGIVATSADEEMRVATPSWWNLPYPYPQRFIDLAARGVNALDLPPLTIEQRCIIAHYFGQQCKINMTMIGTTYLEFSAMVYTPSTTLIERKGRIGIVDGKFPNHPSLCHGMTYGEICDAFKAYGAFFVYKCDAYADHSLGRLFGSFDINESPASASQVLEVTKDISIGDLHPLIPSSLLKPRKFSRKGRTVVVQLLKSRFLQGVLKSYFCDAVTEEAPLFVFHGKVRRRFRDDLIDLCRRSGDQDLAITARRLDSHIERLEQDWIRRAPISSYAARYGGASVWEQAKNFYLKQTRREAAMTEDWYH